MRQIPADKYNVAWFKLADFVIRGEKERALGVYRLLMHAINDEALALQLEGDILLAFNDPFAIDRYRSAAQAYMHAQRWVQALGIYEQIKSLEALTYEDILAMLELCHILNFSSQLVVLCKNIGNYLENKQQLHDIKELIEHYKKTVSVSHATELETCAAHFPSL